VQEQEQELVQELEQVHEPQQLQQPAFAYELFVSMPL
jgi:hypothetical protein